MRRSEELENQATVNAVYDRVIARPRDWLEAEVRRLRAIEAAARSWAAARRPGVPRAVEVQAEAALRQAVDDLGPSIP